jgi:hypothetical protein
VDITIDAKILTATLEIINCEAVNVTANVSVQTVSVDNSPNVSLTFASPDFAYLVAWANAPSASLTVASERINLDVVTAPGQTLSGQVLTVKNKDGSFVSKPSQRDRCGRLLNL